METEVIGVHSDKVVARFMSKVEQPAHGHACWFWIGSFSSGNRAAFWLGKNNVMASRVSWEIANRRQFPAGLFACHGCDNPQCVNPDHIRADTQSSNIRESRDKGRSTQGIKKQTHCKRGHELTPENSRRHRKWRLCAQCARDRGREWYRKHKGKGKWIK